MRTQLTAEQIALAQQLHSQGLTWLVVASYLGVNVATLNKYRKRYDNNNKILGATETS